MARLPRIAGRAWLTLAVGAALAVACAPASRADVFIGLQPVAVTVAPGDTFTVTLAILQADSAFNAFDASVRFDPAMVAFVPTSPVANQRGELMTAVCGNILSPFTAAPDSLRISLSLICGDTFVTGPGVIYRVRFRAGSTPGSTVLTLGSFTEFYHAGFFVRPLHKQSMTVTVQGPAGVEEAPRPGDRLDFAPPAPNPGRGGGGVRLGFALPVPDEVIFTILDVQGRRIAGRDAEHYDGGRHVLAWSPRGLPSGNYFIRLQSRSSGTAIRRWAVLR